MGIRASLQNLTVVLALILALSLVASLDTRSAGARESASSVRPSDFERGGGYGYGEDYYFRTGEVVVMLNPLIGATIGEIRDDYGSALLASLPGNTDVHLLKLPEGSNTEETARWMSLDPRLLFAEPNFVAEPPEAGGRMRARAISGTAATSKQYAKAALNLSCANKISNGSDVTVAVLDTGAQLNHRALKTNFAKVARYDFVGDDPVPSDDRDGLDADGNGYADERVGHGTHVAGIVDLVAPGAKIMPLRVLDSEGYGDVFAIAEAVAFARDNGAEVINMSFSTPGRSRLLMNSVRQATREGVIVAAAAGNENNEVKQYPAAGGAGWSGILGLGSSGRDRDGLLAVTSVDAQQKKSDFASFGDWVSVAAPGDDIRSAFPVGFYANWSGTSMATPFVSGQAALIRSVAHVRGDHSRDSAAAEDLIRTSARPLDGSNPEYADKLGSGHADIGGALKTLKPGICSQQKG